MKKRLLPDGSCGATIKRRTRDEEEPDDVLKIEVKARSKLLRKTGERKIL